MVLTQRQQTHRKMRFFPSVLDGLQILPLSRSHFPKSFSRLFSLTPSERTRRRGLQAARHRRDPLALPLVQTLPERYLIAPSLTQKTTSTTAVSTPSSTPSSPTPPPSARSRSPVPLSPLLIPENGLSTASIDRVGALLRDGQLPNLALLDLSCGFSGPL